MMKPRLEELTLREKIGQTACAPFYNKDYWAISDFDTFFKENPIGVLWYLHGAMNFYEQASVKWGTAEQPGCVDNTNINYINAANKALRIPLLPVMDAGRGIGAANFPGHPSLPAATSLGAANDPELAYRYGNLLGKDAHSLGFRWIWSPVADNSGCYNDARGISSDYEVNKKILSGFICGMQDAGVAACAKHFPGQDPYDYRDSHFCTSSYDQSFEYWQATQGREFQACVDAGVASIMIGHTTFGAADDTRVNGCLLPCTLSYKVITELLKGKMGFKGVVITDDTNMKALSAIYPRKKMYVELLRAGNDVILNCDLDYIDIIEKAVLDGELPESRIDDACQRVLDMKERFGMFEQGQIPYRTEKFGEELAVEFQQLCRDIADKSLTLVANRTNFLPVSAQKIRKVKIVYIGYSDACYNNLRYAAEEFSRHGAQCDIQNGFTDEDNKTLDQYDLIIYATYIGMHAPEGGNRFFGEKCRMMRKIMTVATEKSMGVSFGDPDIFFNYFTAAKTFVNCYSFNPETMEAFVRGLYGEISFTDYAPFPLNPITRTNNVY